jgi:hypothetical protein
MSCKIAGLLLRKTVQILRGSCYQLRLSGASKCQSFSKNSVTVFSPQMSDLLNYEDIKQQFFGEKRIFYTKRRPGYMDDSMSGAIPSHIIIIRLCHKISYEFRV